MANKEAEVKALQQALAQERARREADMKAQADAAKREAIETARRKVAEERAKTVAELRAMEAEKAWLQQQREREATCAQEEAERRAAEATAAAMEEAERKICCDMPPGASRVDTLRWFFDGDPASRMKIDRDAEDSRNSEGSGPATRPRRKGKGKTPERPRRSAERHPDDSDPFVTCSNGDARSCRPCHKPTFCKVGALGAGGGGGDDISLSLAGEGPPAPYRGRESTPGRPPPTSGPRWGDMDTDEDM